MGIPRNARLQRQNFEDRQYPAVCPQGGGLVKSLIKRGLATLGYEIRKVAPLNSPEPAPGEKLSEQWHTEALQMANRFFRPPNLQYRPTIYGVDKRLKYMSYFLDVRDQRVLEIGPLEGHHSIILEKMGIRQNIAIEARVENLEKCDRIKQTYHLDRTEFVQYDLEKLYKGEVTPNFEGRFDLVFCLGVLYHLPDPGRGLEWMRSQGSTLFLGTHYSSGNPTSVDYVYKGKTYKASQAIEGGIADPVSGMSAASMHLYEDDLLRLIHDAGYSTVSVLGKDLQNNAPHITVLAEA